MLKPFTPAQLLAMGLGVAAIVWAGKFLVEGIGMMISTVIGTIETGIAVTAFATWTIPTVCISVSLIAVSKIALNAAAIKKEPYQWLVPVLGICSAGVASFCKAYLPYDNEGVKVIFEVAVGALYILSGYLWEKDSPPVPKTKFIWRRMVAVVLFLIPPVYVFCAYAAKRNEKLIAVFHDDIPADVTVPVMGLLGLFAATLLAYYALKKHAR